MLLEWLSFKMTPASEEARALGYLKEHIAIQARHRRCREAWKDHLEKTRRFVLWAAASCPKQDKITILGSGGLLDVPLVDLADDFGEVVLVDILHPPAVKKWAQQYSNVRLAEADVTEMAANFLEGKIPDTPPMPTFEDADADGDLIVSLNMLGQLPLVLIPHLPADWTAAKKAAFAAETQWQHLRALKNTTGRVCLITGVEREWLDGDGVDARERPLAEIKLPTPNKNWYWDLAPAPELEKDRDLRLKIHAYLNLFKK